MRTIDSILGSIARNRDNAALLLALGWLLAAIMAYRLTDASAYECFSMACGVAGFLIGYLFGSRRGAR